MKTQDKLEEIFHVLDEYLGDTDPYISEDMGDEDIKSEEPIFWVTKEIRSLIDTQSLQPEITEEEVRGVLDEWDAHPPPEQKHDFPLDSFVDLRKSPHVYRRYLTEAILSKLKGDGNTKR